jgi:phasin family protein
MKTQNPFDLSDVFKKFDPAAIGEQYKGIFGKFNLPNLDMTALIEAQNKNVQALTAANRAMLEGTKALMQRQGEMVKQVLEEASEAVKSVGSVSTAQDAAEKEIKLIEDSVSKALTNFSEISEMARNTQEETTKLVTTRFNESLAELRANIAKLKPEGKKDA